MVERPRIKEFNDGSKIWSHRFCLFNVKVYIPVNSLPDKIINFGFEAPYLIILAEEYLSDNQAKVYADSNGYTGVASHFATSVVFISPNNGNWDDADEELYKEIIFNSKIHQYYEDGFAILNNRFTNNCEGFAIRGAIFRTVLIGKGKSADYIASYLLKAIEGQGLWGPADIAPTVCVLEDLNIVPQFDRSDMPIVSINNGAADSKINDCIRNKTFHYYMAGDNETFEDIFYVFIGKYKRWGFDGDLLIEPDLSALNMVREVGVINVSTSKDNEGDNKNLLQNEIGYVAYYNNNLFKNGPVPALLCFHGGGDSAMYIAMVAEWYRVASDNNFMLICIENHLNSTATEMISFLKVLCSKYLIDKSRIYASGFSMGGCKTWDLFQEYPEVFAGLAPMSATFEVGLNVYGMEVNKLINREVLVPLFYVGGEMSPLPELPFQAKKCLDRMKYVLEVNKTNIRNNCEFPTKIDNNSTYKNWENSIWGINGDVVEKIYDPSRNDTLVLHKFYSNDNKIYTVFGSVINQGHECRYHSCEQAYKFLKQFRRLENGEILIEG